MTLNMVMSDPLYYTGDLSREKFVLEALDHGELTTIVKHIREAIGPCNFETRMALEAAIGLAVIESCECYAEGLVKEAYADECTQQRAMP